MDFQASMAAVDTAFRAGFGFGVCGGIAVTLVAYLIARWVQERRP